MKHRLFLYAGLLAALLGLETALAAPAGGGGGTQPLPPRMTYTIGGTVSGLAGTGLVLQNNGAGNLSLSANGSFTFAAALNLWQSYNVTVLTQPSVPAQACTVAGGAGIVDGNVTNIAVTCQLFSPRFAYVANQTSNTVSIYAVNAETGQLRPNGYVTAAGRPRSVTVDPSGRYAYVANGGDGINASTVSQYTIGATGGLAPMTAATVAAGVNPSSVTVDPNGHYAYVANEGDDTVSQYTIGADGALTPMAQATVLSETNPCSVTVHPSGRFAYVANQGASNTVSQYTIGADGALTPMAQATVLAGIAPFSVTVHPSGRYAYVANLSKIMGPVSKFLPPQTITFPGTVSQYTIGADGALSPMATPTVAAGLGPISVTVDPSGRYAYVADSSDATVSQYTIGADGALNAMPTPTVAAKTGPASVTVDPSGRYAYVANFGDNTVSQYAIGATGALSAIAVRPTVPTHNGPAAITVTKGTAPVVYTPKYAYVTNYGGTDVSQYTIGADGALSLMSTPTVAAGLGPASVAVDPSGRYAYVANQSDFTGIGGTVSQYTIGPDGTLTPMATSTVAAGLGPISVTVDPSGRYVYVVNGGDGVSASTVSQFTVGAGGGLTPMTSPAVPAGMSSQSITIDPSGHYAYVANSGDNTVSQYRIGAGGALSPMATPTVAAGTFPRSVTVDPSGRYAYVVNPDFYTGANGSVSQYTVGTDGRLIAMTPATVATGSSPRSVTVEPNGRYAYVVNAGNTVSLYTIGVDGALSAVTAATVATGVKPVSVTVDPSGRYVYVVNGGASSGLFSSYAGGISQYTIGANGALSAMTPPEVAAADRVFPSSIVTLGVIQ